MKYFIEKKTSLENLKKQLGFLTLQELSGMKIYWAKSSNEIPRRQASSSQAELAWVVKICDK